MLGIRNSSGITANLDLHLRTGPKEMVERPPTIMVTVRRRCTERPANIVLSAAREQTGREAQEMSDLLSAFPDLKKSASRAQSHHVLFPMAE
ncbi:hypothetical protein AB0I81_45250 [Nonomuraea sp. NPDC050404]|uniref:hypothetical protein n=1 Tax=Nonomuraea sp. NPDC050404 TaxID=3155783 RepID=UPI0033C253C1